MADDKVEKEIDPKKLTTEQKIKSDKWSTRKLGYEELIKNIKDADEPDDPDFELFLNLVKETARFTNDPIEPSREKGVESILTFLESKCPSAAKCADEILTGLFSKCLTGKPIIRSNAMKIIDKCVELDKQTVVQEKLIEGLGTGQPLKVIQFSAECLRNIITEYGGPKVLNFKPIVKELANLINHREKNIRDEVKSLSFEMCKFNSKAFLKDLKEAEKLADKEYDAFENDWIKIKEETKGEKPVQTKYRKSEAKQKAEQEAAQMKIKQEEAELKAKQEAAEIKAKQDLEITAQEAKRKLEQETKRRVEEAEKLANEMKSRQELELQLDAQRKLDQIKLEEDLVIKQQHLKQQQTSSPVSSKDSKFNFNRLKSIDEIETDKKQVKTIDIESKKIDDALIQCLVEDGRSSSDFHKPGMLKFLQIILPGYVPPSNRSINRILEHKKLAYDKHLINNIFKDINDIALSAETFQNNKNTTFICLRAHFLDKMLIHKTVVLSFKRFISSLHMSEKINIYIKKEINRFNINGKIRTITTDNSELMIRATNDSEFGTRLSCLITNLNLTIINSLSSEKKSNLKSNEYDFDLKNDKNYLIEDENYSDENEEFNSDLESSDDEALELNEQLNSEISSKTIHFLLDKVRRLIRLILNSKTISNYVRSEAKSESIKLKLVIDLELRWYSTFLMIDRFLNYKKIIDKLINDLIDSSHYNALKSLKITVNEWMTLKALCEVLTTFSKAADFILKVPFNQLSLAHVISSGLKRYLSEQTIDVRVNTIKGLILENFNIYFENSISPTEKTQRLIATYLNPTHFRYLTESDRYEAEKYFIDNENNFTIKKSMANIAKSVMTAQKSREALSKRSSLSGIWEFDIGQPMKNVDLTFREEMVSYVARLKRLVTENDYKNFWNQEKFDLQRLFSLVKQTTISPISSLDSNSFSISSFNQKKNLSCLNSKSLFYAMVLKNATL